MANSWFVIDNDPYSQDITEAAQAIQGRRFNRITKEWCFPPSAATAEPLAALLKKHRYDKAPGVDAALRKLRKQAGDNEAISTGQTVDVLTTKQREWWADFSRDLPGTPYPFQVVGVAGAMAQSGTAICDEPGLGKTVQALLTLRAKKAFPAVVVVPSCVKFNWLDETRKWVPGVPSSVVEGRQPQSYSETGVTIINYDILGDHLEALQDMDIQAVVLDESHYIKNHKSGRTEAVKKLGHRVPLKLCLSGTPMPNRPKELWTQINFLGRGSELGGFWGFHKRYCAGRQKSIPGRGLVWDFDGASNLEELNEKLRVMGIMIRRRKVDVLTELPPKTRSVVPIPIEDRSEYNKAAVALIAWVREQAAQDADFLKSIEHLSATDQETAKQERADSKAEAARRAEELVRLNALKKLTAKLKLPGAMDWIRDLLDSGQKVILFAHHKTILTQLAKKFKAPKIVGDTSARERKAIVDEFQAGKHQVVVCSIKAAGVGLTLTGPQEAPCSNVVFLELPWTPAELDQAEDRAHRIGQKSHVTAWYLLARDTIETKIAAILDKKREVSGAALDATSAGVVSSLLAEML